MKPTPLPVTTGTNCRRSRFRRRFKTFAAPFLTLCGAFAIGFVIAPFLGAVFPFLPVTAAVVAFVSLGHLFIASL